MDTRAIITGSLAAIAILCGTTLAALNTNPQTIAACFGLASTFAGYAVGLYSEPVTKASSDITSDTGRVDDAA